MLKKIGLNLFYSFLLTLFIALGSVIYLLDEDLKQSLQIYSVYLPVVWIVIFLILMFQSQVKYTRENVVVWAKKSNWNQAILVVVTLVLIVGVIGLLVWVALALYK